MSGGGATGTAGLVPATAKVGPMSAASARSRARSTRVRRALRAALGSCLALAAAACESDADDLRSLRDLLSRGDHVALLEALDRRAAGRIEQEDEDAPSERRRMRVLALAGLGRGDEVVAALTTGPVEPPSHYMRVAQLLAGHGVHAEAPALEVVAIASRNAPEERERFEALAAWVSERTTNDSAGCGEIVDMVISYVGGGRPCLFLITYEDGCTY